jgi:hypothetical protein
MGGRNRVVLAGGGYTGGLLAMAVVGGRTPPLVTKWNQPHTPE